MSTCTSYVWPSTHSVNMELKAASHQIGLCVCSFDQQRSVLSQMFMDVHAEDVGQVAHMKCSACSCHVKPGLYSCSSIQSMVWGISKSPQRY